MAKLTWKKQPSEKGLARIGQADRGLLGSFNGFVGLRVAPKYLDPYTRSGLSWFFSGAAFGHHMNTLHETGYATKEEARDAATVWFKAMDAAQDRDLDKAIARAKLEWGIRGTAAIESNGTYLVGIRDFSSGKNVLVEYGRGKSFKEAFRKAEDREEADRAIA